MSGKDVAGGVLLWVLFGAVVYGGYVATVSTVTVPVIWPLATTVLCLFGAYRAADRWMQRQLADRRTVTRPVRPDVRHVLHGQRTGNLIGDYERDIVADALRIHFADGRLTQDELHERLAKTLAARTLDDLADAVTDLPSELDGQ